VLDPHPHANGDKSSPSSINISSAVPDALCPGYGVGAAFSMYASMCGYQLIYTLIVPVVRSFVPFNGFSFSGTSMHFHSLSNWPALNSASRSNSE